MRRTALGFTLVEVIVAVAIFALASALAYGGLAAVTRTRTQLEAQNARLARLQFAVGLLERDLRSVALRPVRDRYGAPLPPLLGTAERVELSRHGYANSLALPRAELERVGYRWQRDTLERLRFPVLDRAPGSEPRVDALLDAVDCVRFAYLAADGRELAQWPPPRATSDAPPRAVIAVMRLPDYGEVRRVLELPDEARP